MGGYEEDLRRVTFDFNEVSLEKAGDVIGEQRCGTPERTGQEIDLRK